MKRSRIDDPPIPTNDTEALADILAGRWVDAGEWQKAVASLSALNEASRDKRGDAGPQVGDSGGDTGGNKGARPKRTRVTINTPQRQQPISGGLFAASTEE